MIITVASDKGGSGKTTTAVHLAAYFQTLAPTLLLDGDDTKNALDWNQDGPGLPFRVAVIEEGPKLLSQFAHTVIDTGQRPDLDDLKAAVKLCDLVIVPAPPVKLDISSTVLTIRKLRQIGGAGKCRVLLTKVAPNHAGRAAEFREKLAGFDVPTLAAEIPRLTAYEKAAEEGLTAHTVHDRNAVRAWDAYAAAGKEINRG